MSGRTAQTIRNFSLEVSTDLVLLDIRKSTFQHLTVNWKVTSSVAGFYLGLQDCVTERRREERTGEERREEERRGEKKSRAEQGRAEKRREEKTRAEQRREEKRREETRREEK